MLSLLAAAAFAQAGHWMPATKNSVVYEVNLRAFSRAGDLPSVTKELPRLKSLGVTIIWLMPIFPVGKIKAVPPMGSPYAVADYDRVNPEFGSEADLKKLVASAHARSMAVILDWVGDHTAWDNPWLVHKDWYLRDSSGNPIPPPGTGWADVAKLDYASAPMRSAMIASMKRWVVQDDVDGFRCDAADMIPNDFWQEAITELRASVHRRLFFLAEGNHPEDFKAGFDAIYGWDFYHALRDIFSRGKPATDLAGWDARERRGAGAGQEPLRFTTNHDEWAFTGPTDRVFGSESAATAAFALACFYGPGFPLVYDGQEIGWDKPIGIFNRDPIGWNSPGTGALAPSRILQLRQLLHLESEVDLSTKDAVVLQYAEGSWILVNVRPFKSAVHLPQEVDLVDEISRTRFKGSDFDLDPFQVLVLLHRKH